MGPVIQVPSEVVSALEAGDLVEAVVDTPGAVDTVDVQLGPDDGVLLLLVEVPVGGFDELVGVLAGSGYAHHAAASGPFVLTVRDGDGTPHPWPDGPVTESSVRRQLSLAYFGEPGDRRPLLPDRTS